MLRTQPWVSTDEWMSVAQQLFSDSRDQVELALRRIDVWQCRLMDATPLAVVASASLIRLLHYDGDQQQQCYCLAMNLIRLVNGVTDQMQYQYARSVASIALEINMPASLVHIRHASTHGALPKYPMLIRCAHQALDWLKTYYWDVQQTAFQSDVAPELISGLPETIDTLVSIPVSEALSVARVLPLFLASRGDPESEADLCRCVKRLSGRWRVFAPCLLEQLIQTTPRYPKCARWAVHVVSLIPRVANCQPEPLAALMHALRCTLTAPKDGMATVGPIARAICSALSIPFEPAAQLAALRPPVVRFKRRRVQSAAQDEVAQEQIGIWQTCASWSSDIGTLEDGSIPDLMGVLVEKKKTRKRRQSVQRVSLQEPQVQQVASQSLAADVPYWETPQFSIAI